MNYKIIYTPNIDDGVQALDRDINFLCADNKLHIRLRDYDKEEVIHGFIDKLTYVVTYLCQRVTRQDLLTNNIIEKFVKSDSSIKDLNTQLLQCFLSSGKKYKGLKILPNYRKVKHDYSTPVGSFKKGVCPLENDVTYGDLQFFNKILKWLTLEEFLLNDAIDLVISKDKVKDNYIKFINKGKKVKKENLEYIPLF